MKKVNFTSEVATFSFHTDICKNLISMALFVKGGSYLNIFVNSVVVLIVLLKISHQCESGEAVHTTSTSSTTLQPKLQKLIAYDWYEHKAVQTSTALTSTSSRTLQPELQLSTSSTTLQPELQLSTSSTTLQPELQPSASSTTLQPELQPSASSTTLQPILQELPGCDADWRHIRTANYVYVDKTPHLMRMLLEKPHKHYFVTRPRRFGKTTFIQMIAQFFRGEKSLFHNLEIDAKGNNYFRKKLWPYSSPFKFDNDSKWIKFPVIELDFSKLDFTTIEEFDRSYHWRLRDIAVKHNIIQQIPQPPSIDMIIDQLHVQYNLPVIVLIDEYDFPLQYALVMCKNKTLAEHVKRKLTDFFRLIKASSQEIGFTLVVGITKIELSMFESAGNNFHDMTYDEIMAHTFGLTEQELVKNMKDHIKAFADATNYEDSSKNTAEGRVVSQIKQNYDGYNYNINNDSAIRVMNPISTIQCLANRKFLAYWHVTKSNDYIGRAFAEIGAVYSTFDPSYATTYSILLPERPFNPLINNIPLPALLFMYGYVTVSHYNQRKGKITLKYPNAEIKDVVKNELAEYQPLKGKSIQECEEEGVRLFSAMNCGYFQKAINILRTFEFTPFLHPSTENVTPQEITRRLNKIFVRSRIRFEEGLIIMKDWKQKEEAGDIDFVTTDLNVNYAISVKCGEGGGAFEAIIQVIEYIHKFPKGYINALKGKKVDGRNVYLMGLGFSYYRGGYLEDWIVIPYRNGAFQYDSIQADSEELRMKMVGKLESLKSKLRASRDKNKLS